MNLLIGWIVNAVTLFITPYIVPGFKIADFQTALLASIVIGLLNIVIKPILLLLTLPINFLTLGLFTFVINAVVLWLATFIVSGMTIDSALSGILAAIVISVVSTILSHLLKDLKIT